MCRWIAYSGTPVLLSHVLLDPRPNLIDQSLRSRLGVETTNGDGFGVGWYTRELPTPAVLRDAGPAWNGLTEDPPGAVARMAGLIEHTGRGHGVPHPLQMTLAVADGDRLWAFRYSSEGSSRSLFHSTRVDSLRALHPDTAFLREVGDETRLIVSEPLGNLPGVWHEVPENSYGVVQPREDVLHPFQPSMVTAGAG